jgi:hypothetical protein
MAAMTIPETRQAQRVMTRKTKAIYWISTLWLALGMLSTGLVQLLRMKAEGGASVDGITHLGYPVYLLTILGVWKLLGVAAVLAPKSPLLKEWAYAGFFFDLTGAAVSHAAVGDPVADILAPMFFLALVAASWALRPSGRMLGAPAASGVQRSELTAATGPIAVAA